MQAMMGIISRGNDGHSYFHPASRSFPVSIPISIIGSIFDQFAWDFYGIPVVISRPICSVRKSEQLLFNAILSASSKSTAFAFYCFMPD